MERLHIYLFGKAAGIPDTNIYGIEVFQEMVDQASQHIRAYQVDLEKQLLPFTANFFDVVICNQVLEHLKNVFLPMNEIWRVTKPGGILILSTPNLAAVHNRLLMLIGKQPTCIRTFGPHIRGFTANELIRFATEGGLFELEDINGIGWHPLKANGLLCKALVKAFPLMAHTVVLVLRKRKVDTHIVTTWMKWINQEGIQTNFMNK